MRRLFLIAAAATICTATSFAATVTTGNWYVFLFNDVGSYGGICPGCNATNPATAPSVTSPWTFSGSATLTVVDLYSSGDQFSVFDNSSPLGQTSTPSANGACGGDIGCALADSTHYSFGIYNLGSGSHSISIQTVASPFGTGAAAFGLADAGSPTPEPGTFGVAGLALASVAAVVRRRKRSEVLSMGSNQ